MRETVAAGWVVASAAALGLAAAALAAGPDALEGAQGPARVLGVLLLAAVFLSWAHALASAVHGGKAPLLALLGHALAWGVARGATAAWGCRGCLAPEAAGPLVLGVALVLLGAASCAAVLPELRRRRGPLHAARALTLLMPTLLLAGYLVLLGAF